MKYIILYSILFFALAQNSFGQSIKRADKLYNDFGYKSTISVLEKEMLRNNSSPSHEHMRQLANSYRLFHDTQNSEKWYAQVIESTSDPIDYLHYAQALQSNGKHDQAKKYYLLYDTQFGDTDNRGKVLAEAIDRLEDFKRTGVEVKNEGVLNSKKIEFSPSYYGGGLVYVTTKSPNIKSKKDIWLDDNYMSLYQSSKNSDGTLSQPSEFSSKLSSKFHEGPVSFSKDGDQIFFTKSNYSKGKKNLSDDGVLKLQIFTALKKQDKWIKQTALPFNDEESDDAHPSLSADGQKLYFASNRAGGFGGMDLYVAKFANGYWGGPENLGASINTPGNELFPFIHDDGTLYFSSEGHAGLGGLDIFSSVQFEDEWVKPANMGSPINSRMDDLGFIVNVLNSEGYFSSDRRDGIGKDDIYSFKVVPNELLKPIVSRLNAVICTVEKGSDLKIPNVTIHVSENVHWGDDDDRTYTTDSNGDLNIKLDPEIAYAFRAEKNGYKISEKIFSTEGISKDENISFCIGMGSQQQNCANVLGIVTNAKDGNRIPNASIAITNSCTGTLTTITSNLLGEFESECLRCDCSYNIKGLKEGYVMADEVIDLRNISCEDNQTLFYNIQLYSINDDPALVNNSRISQSDSPFEVTVGTNIILEDIYYDFDEHDIRRDAARSLDKLSGLLRVYPMMEIELSAHTDSRGTTAYNKSLSEKRAESAKMYLLGNGIAGYRIIAAGYGEGSPRNHCTDDIICNEEQHQYNRRTIVKVTSMGGESVPVSYSNNPPPVVDKKTSTSRPTSSIIPEIKERYTNPIGNTTAPVTLQVSGNNHSTEYKIQVFSSTSPDRYFYELMDLGQIELEFVPNRSLTRYLIANALSYQDAMAILPKLKDRGYGRSFIVPYVNGIRTKK